MEEKIEKLHTHFLNLVNPRTYIRYFLTLSRKQTRCICMHTQGKLLQVYNSGKCLLWCAHHSWLAVPVTI